MISAESAADLIPMSIRIVDIDAISELTQVRALETEVWGLDPIDVLPLTMLIAMRAVGAVLLGAFDGPTLVGFVYGFPGIEDGRTTIHSHVLAVSPGYRDLDLGYRLKVVQRERALALGVSVVTWTFDPLQSKNAYFNFMKLGVVADTYKVDFYGADCSSFLLRDSTDRLWVRWPIGSERVRARLDARTAEGVDPTNMASATTLVDAGMDGAPWVAERCDAPGHDLALVHIPEDINAILADNATLAAAWRSATRRAFTEAFAAGFVVEAFVRPDRATRRCGAYVLRRRDGDDR